MSWIFDDFKLEDMTSFRAEKCFHLVSEPETSVRLSQPQVLTGLVIMSGLVQLQLLFILYRIGTDTVYSAHSII